MYVQHFSVQLHSEHNYSEPEKWHLFGAFEAAILLKDLTSLVDSPGAIFLALFEKTLNTVSRSFRNSSARRFLP